MNVNFCCFNLPKFIIILHHTIISYNKEKQKSSSFSKKFAKWGQTEDWNLAWQIKVTIIQLHYSEETKD